MNSYGEDRLKVIDCTLGILKDIWTMSPSLRLMQLLTNAGVFNAAETVYDEHFIKDPYNIKDEYIISKLAAYTPPTPKIVATKSIDWEAIKKTPLYVPADRVPIDSAKYIIYKGDKDFNGTSLPVYFYIHIPYCANEEKTF